MDKIKFVLCIIILTLIFFISLLYRINIEHLVSVWYFFQCQYLNVSIDSCSDFSQLYQFFNIIFFVRIPRLLVSMLCGAGLGAAGVITQGIFRNPLVSPSVIGITSGSVLLASFCFYFFTNLYVLWLLVPLSAILGAAIISSIIIFVLHVHKFKSIEYLLLVGVAINTFLGACTTLIISIILEDTKQIYAIMHWLLGDVGAKSWEHFGVGFPLVFLGIVGALRICVQLDVLSLGEDIAYTLGINIFYLKVYSIIICALLVGGATSIAGAISFVGLIVPHISRMMVGPEHKKVLILSIINGMSLLLIADFVARNIRYPYEIQLGVFTALIGSLFFLYLLFKKY